MELKNLVIERKQVPLAELKPAEYNPRVMYEDELVELENSYKEFGELEDLVVNNDGTIIGGHQRFKVGQRLGLATLWCKIVEVDKKTEKKLNLALNKIRGHWDEPKLAELIAELQDEKIVGFSDEEVNQYILRRQLQLENKGEYDPDEDEELQKLFERNERVPIKVAEPDETHKKDQLAFYTDSFDEYKLIRETFKTKRKGELDKGKLINLIKPNEQTAGQSDK
jgi:ParB-like chromosome segregation protein Spo0J